MDKFPEAKEKALRFGAYYAEGKIKDGFDKSGRMSKSGVSIDIKPPPAMLKIRTGHLKRSIHSKVDDRGGYVYTQVDYGIGHELTYKENRPFLKPGVENNQEAIGKIIEETFLEEIIGK